MQIILESISFILPAYIANMMPVVFRWVPFAGQPISKKLFGEHKTYRGFIFGILGAIATMYFQKRADAIFIGALFGIGALGGDLVKSYFKRRIGIPEGSPWIPFDQLDFALGALIAISPWLTPSPLHFIILLITPILHFTTNVLGYFLGLKKVWW